MLISGAVEQLRDLVRQSNDLIILGSGTESNTDIVCATLAWRNQLKRRDKNFQIILEDFDSAKFAGLPYLDEIERILPDRRTILKIGLGDTGIKKVSYEIKDNNLFFYINPKSGTIQGEQVEVLTEEIKTDLIIVLGLSNPGLLKTWPQSWPQDFFDRQPIVNIDNHSENSQFGTINVIDTNPKTISQLSLSLFMNLGWEIDADTATLLLAGIKSGTESFSRNLDAEVFESAATLMRNGGRIEGFGSKIDSAKAVE